MDLGNDHLCLPGVCWGGWLHSSSLLKFSCPTKTKQPESDQASRSDYQFTGNIEDRETN